VDSKHRVDDLKQSEEDVKQTGDSKQSGEIQKRVARI
jgi:hypothetical protein